MYVCVQVMTASPDVMPGSATVLQALHQMQLGGYRNVPVVSDAGEPLGVLGVLALLQGALLRPGEISGCSPAASPASICSTAPPRTEVHSAPALPSSCAAAFPRGDVERRVTDAPPPLPCQPPEGWVPCDDGGFVRVGGEDEPVAEGELRAATPRSKATGQLGAVNPRNMTTFQLRRELKPATPCSRGCSPTHPGCSPSHPRLDSTMYLQARAQGPWHRAARGRLPRCSARDAVRAAV